MARPAIPVDTAAKLARDVEILTQLSRSSSGGGGAGGTDHGTLAGLTDDDHSQYHTDTRGDARYYTQAQVDSSLAGKSNTSHNHAGVYDTAGSAAAAQSAAIAASAPSAHVGAGGTAHANVVAGGAAGFMTGADKTKLDGIATGATANSTDATLLNRANHTGTQAAGTITGLAAVATSGSASDLGAGTLPAGRLPAHTGEVTSSAGSAALTITKSGILSDIQIAALNADFTTNNALGVQSAFPTANDVFTVAANTAYKVRGQYYLSKNTTNTCTLALAWALGSATVDNFEYMVTTWRGAANGLVAPTCVRVTGVASKVINSTGTDAEVCVQFEGILRIGTGGTITPQINWSAAPGGTGLMRRGSWVSFERLGANTVTTTSANWG